MIGVEKEEQVMLTEMMLTRGEGEEEERVWLDIKGEEVTVTHPGEEGIVYEEGNPDGGTQLAEFLSLGYVVTDLQNIMVDVTEEVPIITKEILTMTDEYLELHAQMAKLKKKADAHKDKIRKFMIAKSLKEITGSDGRYVTFQEAKASNGTSRYTDYLLKDIQLELEPTQLRKVTEIRVNADKLAVILNGGDLSPEKVATLKALKVSNPGTARFVVKKKKS